MLTGSMKKIAMVGLLAGAICAPALAASDNDGWWRGRMMGQGSMMGPGYMMGQGQRGWGRNMMGYGADEMLDRVDGRLAFMKAELKITDAQQAAWDEFAEAVKSTAQTHNDMMRSTMEEMEDGTFLDKPLPERLTIQETHLEARLEEIRTVKAAAEKLYGVLGDDQKKVADDIVLPMMGMGMGAGMGRMRGLMRN